MTHLKDFWHFFFIVFETCFIHLIYDESVCTSIHLLFKGQEIWKVNCDVVNSSKNKELKTQKSHFEISRPLGRMGKKKDNKI